MSTYVLVLMFDFYPNINVIIVTSVDKVPCNLQHLAPLNFSAPSGHCIYIYSGVPV
jgi:hypothetical protein